MEPAVLTDICYAWVVRIASCGTGDQANPRRLELRVWASDHCTYESFFGSLPRFEERERNRVRQGGLRPPEAIANEPCLNSRTQRFADSVPCSNNSCRSHCEPARHYLQHSWLEFNRDRGPASL